MASGAGLSGGHLLRWRELACVHKRTRLDDAKNEDNKDCGLTILEKLANILLPLHETKMDLGFTDEYSLRETAANPGAIPW